MRVIQSDKILSDIKLERPMSSVGYIEIIVIDCAHLCQQDELKYLQVPVDPEDQKDEGHHEEDEDGEKGAGHRVPRVMLTAHIQCNNQEGTAQHTGGMYIHVDIRKNCSIPSNKARLPMFLMLCHMAAIYLLNSMAFVSNFLFLFIKTFQGQIRNF